MGWFPARDRNNRVPPENLNWPMSAGGNSKAWQGGPLFIRQRQFGVGQTNDGKYIPKSDTKLLAEHARKYGYANGVKLGGKKR